MNTTKAKLGASFKWLNATQFLGALNDNIFKLLMILFLIGLHGPSQASNVTALAGAVFVIPFLLFSAFAGKLADRFSKRDIIVATKIAELVCMTAGCVAFAFESVPALYVVLFIMASQSAFFGPSKYSIVPELVNNAQLSRANGLLETLTYLAIIAGTASAALLLKLTSYRFAPATLVCIGIAAVGLLASIPIRRTQPAEPTQGSSIAFVRDIFRTLWSIHRKRDLMLAVLASAYFLLIGAFIYINVIPYGMERLALDQDRSSYLFVIAAIGIGAGALAAAKLSGKNVELGIAPLAALALALSATGLGLVSRPLWIFVFIFLTGLSAGMFIVPVHAFIQLRSPTQRRGRVLAASGFLGWVGVLLASGLIWLFSNLFSMSASQIFIVLGVMTMALAIAMIILLPYFLARFICVLLCRLFFRINVAGLENIPSDKSALLVCNHVSWADALLVGVAQQRRIRFIMDKHFYNIKWLRPIYKLIGAIPISADDPPKKIVASLRRARAAMDAGFIVCIFAEGAMTRNGMMRAFKGGFERIIKNSDYQIIPTYIGGAWPTIFSHYHGRPLSTLPRRLPYRVGVLFGEPMPADSSAQQVHQKVTELSCDYFNNLKSSRKSLAEYFVQSARKNWSKPCISDSTGTAGDKRMNYGRTLVNTIALAGEIDKLTQPDEKVGILLPPSTAAAIVNLAATLLGRVVVNLNYTASEQARSSAITQCNIKRIITSRRFVEKIENLDTLPGLVFLEDIAGNITALSKIKAYLKARCVPRRFLTNSGKFGADDLATVIFSSGSSDRPKGIMLTHHNIISNIEATRMVVRIRNNDNLCAVLPFFHSFGFTCGLWLPLVAGVSAGFVADPLDGRAVGQCARENHSTVLFAPPTFLLSYIRRSECEDFASLRLVVAGAEKLKKQLSDAFEAKFSIRPLEGYGATELSPVVSLNLPDVQSDGVCHVGNKQDSVGHPLPGVAVRIVDTESGEPAAPGQRGLLMVKGPNVMAGYLDKEKETANLLKDGWYNTGDIAEIDADGFITITDRLSRFSKIGGEMVPHTGVEEAFLHALNTHEQVVAVTGVPHPKKGEELVVLYLDAAGQAEELHEIITKSNLPNIWKPRRNNYVKIDSMPLLGSGKLDLKRLKKMALAAKKDE